MFLFYKTVLSESNVCDWLNRDKWGRPPRTIGGDKLQWGKYAAQNVA